jgi:hypothetical protein
MFCGVVLNVWYRVPLPCLKFSAILWVTNASIMMKIDRFILSLMPNVMGQGTRHLVAGTLDPLVRLHYHSVLGAG